MNWRNFFKQMMSLIFTGFDVSENVSQPELSELFLTDNDESDFDGFDTTPDLDTLFLSENETEDFMGF